MLQAALRWSITSWHGNHFSNVTIFASVYKICMD